VSEQKDMGMQQQISVITLAIADLGRSKRFYSEGFGWTPVFENEEIAFYQMNGFVLGTWLQDRLEEDMQRGGLSRPGGFALAHNVASKDDVQPVIDQLVRAGGHILRNADAPPHGGFRGYVADPDDHTWEIAWNPAWAIDADGHVSFGL
jgi:catechol 2,3-dioxygenase-like lactoylglutathione lyase family enzyme